MLRFAKEFVLLDEEAENIVQDIFMVLWEKRAFLDIRMSISSYLFSLVRNRCLDFLHRQVSGDYQRLAYIINDYQGVHFERLSF